MVRGGAGAGFAAVALAASLAVVEVGCPPVAEAAMMTAGDPRPDRGDTSSALPEAAVAADSLDAFWRGVDRGWFDRMDTELRDFGLDAGTLDSLTAAGDAKLDALAAGRLWDFDLDLMSRNTYNRVQGVTIGLGGSVGIAGPDRPRLTAGGAYRFGTKRPLFDAKLDWPVLVRHRWLSHGLGRGRPYQLLRLDLNGYQEVRTFGGDGRRDLRALTTALYGADPNQYYEARGGRLRVHVDTGRRVRLYAGLRWEEQRALAVTTDWNLFGQDLSPAGNLPAADLRDRAVETGVSYQTRGRWLAARASLGWHRVDQSSWLEGQSGSPSRVDVTRLAAHATWDHRTAAGHRVLLSGHYRAVDRQAPLQWKTYLGDYGTLRGYPHAELVGDRGAWASLDVRWDFDLWRALRMPLLKNLRLQPILFTDWGRTWDHAGGEPSTGTQDWRMNAGFGFGKLLGVPGLKGNVRLYVSRPVLDGVGRDWRVLLAFEN